MSLKFDLFSSRMPTVLWMKIFSYHDFSNPYRFIMNHALENQDTAEIDLRVQCKHFYSALHTPKHLSLGRAGPWHRRDLSSIILFFQLLAVRGIHIPKVNLPIGTVPVNCGNSGLSIARKVRLRLGNITFVGHQGKKGTEGTDITGAVEILGAQNIHFQDINFHNYGGNGMIINEGAEVRLKNCAFMECSRAGLKVMPGSKVIAENCGFGSNGESGALIASAQGLFYDCCFLDNKHGLTAKNGAKVHVHGEKTRVENNRQYGIYAMIAQTQVDVHMSESKLKARCKLNGTERTNDIDILNAQLNGIIVPEGADILAVWGAKIEYDTVSALQEAYAELDMH